MAVQIFKFASDNTTVTSIFFVSSFPWSATITFDAAFSAMIQDFFINHHWSLMAWRNCAARVLNRAFRWSWCVPAPLRCGWCPRFTLDTSLLILITMFFILISFPFDVLRYRQFIRNQKKERKRSVPLFRPSRLDIGHYPTIVVLSVATSPDV